jgi:hypothetical protein
MGEFSVKSVEDDISSSYWSLAVTNSVTQEPEGKSID